MMLGPARWRALAVAVTFGLMAWGGIALTSGTERFSAIWLANGLLLGCLLISRDRQALSLAAAFVANVVANRLVGDSYVQAIALASCNSLEVSLAFAVLRGRLHNPGSLFTPQVIVRFIGVAVVGAPVISGVLSSTLLTETGPYSFAASLQRWVTAHALGMSVMVPLVLAFGEQRFDWSARKSVKWTSTLPYLLLFAVAVVVFSQTHFQFVYMIFPPLVWVIMRSGYLGTALGIFLVAAVALTFTFAGHGPFSAVSSESIATCIFEVQALLAACLITSYPICAMLVRQKELLASLAASEQELRIIADNSGDVIIHTDRDGVRRYVSAAIERVLGYSPEQATGNADNRFVHPDDREKFQREEERLRNGCDGISLTYRVRHQEGHFVWLEVSAKSLKDADGHVTGWISISRDVSERRRLEQMKEHFVATVNHELRTPLTALLGALGLAASGKVADVHPRIASLLELSKKNGERLALLVNDILDFEKLTTGNMKFNLQCVDVDDLIDAAVVANEPYAQRFNVRYDVVARCSATIEVDVDRFQQIMSNLLSNAAKFSPEGASVEITASRYGDDCIVTVTDYGIGIPEDYRPLLFQPFSQADGSDRRQRGGTGLGMSIVKELTTRMGGGIDFDSAAGEGTRFFLSFPLVDARVATAA